MNPDKGAQVQNIKQFVGIQVAYILKRRMADLEWENRYLRHLLGTLKLQDWGHCQECKLPFADNALNMCMECNATLCARCTVAAGARFEACPVCAGYCCRQCNVPCDVPGCQWRTGCATCHQTPPGNNCAHRLCEQHQVLNECHACL